MSSRIVNICGQDWVMTDIPAPDYSKAKKTMPRFNFTYHYEPSIQPTPASASVIKSEENRQRMVSLYKTIARGD